MAYAFVRNLKTSTGANLKDFAQIQSAERHAKRQDLTGQARQRPDGDHRQNYFWSLVGEGLDQGGADYAAAFKAHKAARDIKTERKGAALGLHLLVGVSPEWLAQDGGDPRDLANPLVQKLIEHAKLWAEEWMGEGAVWAVRYDTDEAGAGVVDILASPVRVNRAGKAKTGKPSISVNKALKELQETYSERTSYAAMQTSWAAYAHAELDPELERGIPAAETGRRNVSPEAYKAGYEAGRAEGAREAEQALTAAQDAAQRLLQDAGREADQIVTDARERASVLVSENKHLRAFAIFVELMKTAIKDVFGEEGYRKIADRVNPLWAKHPDNPDRSPDRQPSPGPSGP